MTTPPQIQSNESWVAAFDMVNGSGTMWRCLFSVIVGCCCGSSIIQMHVTFVVWCQYRYSTKKRNAWHAFPSACQCVAFRKCCMYCIPKSIYCIPKTVMELDVRRCRLSWVVQWTHNRSTRQYHQLTIPNYNFCLLSKSDSEKLLELLFVVVKRNTDQSISNCFKQCYPT